MEIGRDTPSDLAEADQGNRGKLVLRHGHGTPCCSRKRMVAGLSAESKQETDITPAISLAPPVGSHARAAPISMGRLAN
jgi:hypothetical protein